MARITDPDDLEEVLLINWRPDTNRYLTPEMTFEFEVKDFVINWSALSNAWLVESVKKVLFE